MTTAQMLAAGKPDSISSSQSTPICLFPNLTSQLPQSLLVETKATSAIITNSTSQTILRIKSPFFSLSHRKNVHDMDGTHLFTIHKDYIRQGSARYYFEDPVSGAQLLDLLTTWPHGVTKTICTFVNPLSGRQEALRVDGDATTIVAPETGRVVARIERKAFALRHRYRLEVMPGVDVALVVGIMLCLDDQCANIERPKNAAEVSVHLIAQQ